MWLNWQLFTDHDDVIHWRHFLHCIALCEGNPPTSHWWILLMLIKGPVMQSFDISLEVSLNKLLNKELRGRWIKMVICQHSYMYVFSNIKTKSNRKIPSDIKSSQYCPDYNSKFTKLSKVVKKCLSYKPSLYDNVHTAMDTGVPPIENKICNKSGNLNIGWVSHGNSWHSRDYIFRGKK